MPPATGHGESTSPLSPLSMAEEDAPAKVYRGCRAAQSCAEGAKVSEASRAAAAKARLVQALLELEPHSVRDIETEIASWRETVTSSEEDEAEENSFELVQGAASSSQTPAPAPDSPPAQGPPPMQALPMRRAAPVRANPPKRYYTVTRAARSQEHLLGVWHSSWRVVADALQLPGRSLAGTECHARGFRSVGEALAYWESEGWAPPAPQHR